LEQLPAQLAMGRMTERSYRDEVNVILKVWEDEAFFEKATLEHLEEVFNARERQKEQDEHERKIAERRKRKPAPKATSAKKAEKPKEDEEEDVEMDEGQTPDAGVEDEPAENTRQDAPSAEPEALRPAQGSGQAENKARPTSAGGPGQAPLPDEIPGETAAARARRLRPKAEDMFASDEE